MFERIHIHAMWRVGFSLFVMGCAGSAPEPRAPAQTQGRQLGLNGAPAAAHRKVFADVVAINQPLIYNRFGSTNPWGMIYALRRDVDVGAIAHNALGHDMKAEGVLNMHSL